MWWYNGHPEYADIDMDLSRIKSVAICGLGNVAVDCARILLQPAQRLASTDIAEHALQQLRKSSVQHVHLIGRRGPVQVVLYLLLDVQCTTTCIILGLASGGCSARCASQCFADGCWGLYMYLHVCAPVPACFLPLLLGYYSFQSHLACVGLTVWTCWIVKEPLYLYTKEYCKIWPRCTELAICAVG